MLSFDLYFVITISIDIFILYLVLLDVFLKLSDEMVLMIFRWLPKNMLVRCFLVCKRWQRIAYDEVLWTRMDLGSRSLNPGSLGHVLIRGTIILRLAQAEVRAFIKM
jgi:F-box and leucine-rich repeat protein 1 (S-phase kinase-associated protein 2)